MRKVFVAILVLIAIMVAVFVATRKPAVRQLEKEQARGAAVQAYFSHQQADPHSLHCEVTYPVTREIQEGGDPMRAALDEVVRGVTAAEAAEGYFTNLNAGVTVQEFEVSNGEAIVVFSEKFQENMAGACRVSAARSQVEQTLKQFSSIQKVTIRVSGVPDEEVLQP